MQIKAMRINED